MKVEGSWKILDDLVKGFEVKSEDLDLFFFRVKVILRLKL